MDQLRVSLGFHGVITVEPQGRSGGLAFLWKHDSEAKLLGFSKSHIDMEISIVGFPSWRFCGFYGEPNRSLKTNSWDLLRHLGSISSLP